MAIARESRGRQLGFRRLMHMIEVTAAIDAASPARLVSTLATVESTEDGWRLVPSGIELEPETYE